MSGTHWSRMKTSRTMIDSGSKRCVTSEGILSSRRPPSCATVALILSAGVYIVLRLRTIWAPRLWGDELFNYSLSQGTWGTLIKRAGLDMAHPPFFYMLLKPWIAVFHSSMPGLRILTVATAIAAILPFVALGRELRFRTR